MTDLFDEVLPANSGKVSGIAKSLDYYTDRILKGTIFTEEDLNKEKYCESYYDYEYGYEYWYGYEYGYWYGYWYGNKFIFLFFLNILWFNLD